MKIKKNKYLYMLPLVSSLLFAGCSNTGKCETSPPPPVAKIAGITINSSNVIPSINGGASSILLTVHNHADYVISNISYSSDDNDVPDNPKNTNALSKVLRLMGIKASGGSIDPMSASGCRTIPAGGSCQLKITMQTLNELELQGSMKVVANYVDPKYKKSISTSQILNAQYVKLKNSGNAVIDCIGRSTAYAESNPSEYTQSFCYVNGPIGSQLTIESVTTSSPALQLLSYYRAGYIATAGEIMNQEVGITSVSHDAYASGSIDIKYVSAGSSYNTAALIGLTPLQTGPLLISGLVPQYNTAVVSQGVMYVSNVGSATANISNIAIPSGLTKNVATTTCGATLPMGGNCSIGFNINTPKGTGIITVTYDSGATTLQNIVWYNPDAGPVLGYVSNPLTLSFPSTTSESYVMTITNPTGYAVNGLTQVATTAGSGKAVPSTLNSLTCIESDGVTPSGTNILPGGSCTYKINVADASIENGSVLNSLSGTYINSSGVATPYTAGYYIPYNSYAYDPFIVITPTKPSFTILGDGVTTESNTVTVCNTGTAPAVIESPVISGSNLFSIGTNSCTTGSTLFAPPASPQCCSFVMWFGPSNNGTTTNVNGIESIVINYNGGTTGGNSESKQMNYVVTPDTQNLIMTLVTPSGSTTPTGSGTVGSPYMMLGSITGGTLTLQYQNTGTNTLTIQGVQDYNTPSTWQLQSGVGAPACAAGLSLAPNATCQLVYNYNYNSYITMAGGGNGATNQVNLTTPLLVFTDSIAQFASQIPAPAAQGATTVISASSILAVMNNLVSYNTTTEVMTVTTSLSGAAGYSFPITESSTVANVVYFNAAPTFAGVSGATGSTGTDSTGSLYVSTISFNAANGQSGTFTYNVNNLYTGFTLPVLFKINANGQGVGVSLLYSNNTIQ